MLSSINLMVGSREAKLTLYSGDQVIEEEKWTFNDGAAISQTESDELASVAFHDLYDFLNFAVHGDADE